MPPAALLTILQKGLQYTEAEISIGEDGKSTSNMLFALAKLVLLLSYDVLQYFVLL